MQFHVQMFLLLVVAIFVQLVPVSPAGGERSGGKNRKRLNPVLLTAPPEPDPVAESYHYCNLPNRTQHSWEGHSPVNHKLLSIHVMIRHGDRYPLYSIPMTKRPAIDCTLSPKKNPSHPLLSSFINHMSQSGRAHWDASLSSLPRLPNHSTCEMGELTQTGVVQHLRNGAVMHQAYFSSQQVASSVVSQGQLWLESTGKSRTLQSALALLYGLLPDFSWPRLSVRQQWNTLFCGAACDCPARNRYLELEQRRQYHQRAADTELDQTYVAMAAALGVTPRVLRASNPVDALLCHLCHNLAFPCAAGARGNASCLTLQHLAVIRRQQGEDERARRAAGLYHRYAVLAAHPYLNTTAARMERATRAARQPFVFMASAHDITMAPLLSALGLEEAGFPSFAARLVFELWRGPEDKRAKERGRGSDRGPGERKKVEPAFFVRVLYDGEDLTFKTSFCRAHDRHGDTPMCPLGKFLSFVRKDIFRVINATSYQQACHARVL
ncbi:2-phosphoxylose phosphatase 1 isoform X2 [Denticeps clupeoides]|uniref:2-phosphoxylose phosphatase 1 n=1 Tax=Denticeps clupeoides TaxID=299321 RepID=A0AAY4EFK8_9TELE|nr:2-phosphoxylose phosphatase 1 isoform X2 [Denticeps clupeoides]